MAEDFLSQDEVDALLKSTTGEVDEVKEEAEEGGIRNYNLATQERIVRGRMPTYEIINERFARLLRIGLFNFMRRTVDIAVGPVKVIKFSEFVRNLVVPTNLNMVHMKPLRGTALFVFDPELIFLIVDNLFGGDGRYHTRVEGRDFTQTEQRIIQRLLGVVFDEYEKSWKSVYPIQFEYVRSEMNPQFATIATPNEVVVCVTFDIDMGNKGGGLHVCIPYSMVEPIRDTLYSALQGDHLEVDKRWIKLLSQQVQGAEVDVSFLSCFFAASEISRCKTFPNSSPSDSFFPDGFELLVTAILFSTEALICGATDRFNISFWSHTINNATNQTAIFMPV